MITGVKCRIVKMIAIKRPRYQLGNESAHDIGKRAMHSSLSDTFFRTACLTSGALWIAIIITCPKLKLGQSSLATAPLGYYALFALYSL